MDEDEIASFSALSDTKGEISKTDLLVHTKNSSFWKEFRGSKAKPCSHTSKVGRTSHTLLSCDYNQGNTDKNTNPTELFLQFQHL